MGYILVADTAMNVEGVYVKYAHVFTGRRSFEQTLIEHVTNVVVHESWRDTAGRCFSIIILPSIVAAR